MLPLNATAHRALAPLIQHTPLSPGKVEFVWRVAVGPAIARVTRVRLGNDGVLFVDADDRRWATEICRSASLIAGRLNGFLGDGVIKHIKAHHA